MSRIALLSDVNNPHTIRWAQGLAERGHQLLVFSLTAPRSNWFAGYDGICVESVGVDPSVVAGRIAALRKVVYFSAIPRLRKALGLFRPDIVHAHYATSYGLIGRLAGRRPYIVSVWGMDIYDGPDSSALLRAVVTRVLNGADAVLSTSNVMRKRTESLGVKNVIVTPFGVDIFRFSPREIQGAQSCLTIGTVKTLENKYGIEFLIRAFAMLRELGVDISVLRLLIVGDGSLRKALERLSAELDVAAQVVFAGHVAYDNVHEFHRQMEIEVFPSIDSSESFGVSVVEAQACGIPVVVSDIGGLSEVVEQGVTGFVVPPRDIRSLALAIQRLVESGDLRRQMGAAGRERVRSFYSLSESLDRLEAVYTSVRNSPSGHGAGRPGG